MVEINSAQVDDDFIEKPYGGLFGDNALVRVLEEIVADPYVYYRHKDFEEVTGSSAPSIRKALTTLTETGLLEKDAKDPQHPIYKPNLDSKALLALTFLSYALIDDREGTDCLENAIMDHYQKEMGKKLEVSGSRDYDVPLEKIIIKLANGNDICFTCEATNSQK